jgi:hypothetical protein
MCVNMYVDRCKLTKIYKRNLHKYINYSHHIFIELDVYTYLDSWNQSDLRDQSDLTCWYKYICIYIYIHIYTYMSIMLILDKRFDFYVRNIMILYSFL